GLLAAMQRHEAALPERLNFQVPDRTGPNRVVPRDRQRVGAFRLVAREAGGGIEYALQLVAGRHTGRVLGGQFSGDLTKLTAVGQRVLNDDEEFLQLDGYLHNRRQDDDERALLLAGDELVENSLNDLWVAQEAVEVVHHENRRPFLH